MRFVIAVGLVWLSLVPCQAQDVHVDRIDVTEYGIYTSDMSEGREAAQDIRLVTTTRTVPAQLGIKFGFRYVIVGSPQGAKVQLTRIILPPAGAPPSTRDLFTETVGSPELEGAELVNQQYLVPGQWTIQLWYGERELASQTFDVE